MKLLGSLLALVMAGLCAVLAVQRVLRRLHSRWHRRDMIVEDDRFVR